MFYYKLI